MQRRGNVALPTVWHITSPGFPVTSPGFPVQQADAATTRRGAQMPVYAAPGQPGSPATFASRYDNWIGGQRVAPVKGQYFENVSPVNDQVFTEIARSTAEDIELALDAAHAAAPGWGRTSITDRSNI